jgi:hypothetical protein
MACDIVFADTPAISDGSKSSVLFVGNKTQVTDIFVIKTDKDFINIPEDNIIKCGAPNKLTSDCARFHITNKVLDILHTYCIKSWQSGAHQQHQNPAEHLFQNIKTTANCILDRAGVPLDT